MGQRRVTKVKSLQGYEREGGRRGREDLRLSPPLELRDVMATLIALTDGMSLKVISVISPRPLTTRYAEPSFRQSLSRQ